MCCSWAGGLVGGVKILQAMATALSQEETQENGCDSPGEEQEKQY